MKKFVTIVSLTIGIGALIYTVSNVKRKRRRLLDLSGGKIYNQVSKDFGGTVPDQLFKYLRGLGEITKNHRDYELWGYSKSLEFSKRVCNKQEDDVLVILGINKTLTSQEGKTVYLLYTKAGYPDTLIHVTLDISEEEEGFGYLIYHSEVDFEILP